MYKGAVLDGDDEVDGVEVGVTAEAASEVGRGIGCGVELSAARAQESEVSVGGFARPVEYLGDDVIDVDIVSNRA